VSRIDLYGVMIDDYTVIPEESGGSRRSLEFDEMRSHGSFNVMLTPSNTTCKSRDGRDSQTLHW
jgi:hypothetical protein